MADIYTVPGQDAYSQRRIYKNSSRYTARYTQRQIHGGRYTAADIQQHQIKIHSRSLGDLPDIATSPTMLNVSNPGGGKAATDASMNNDLKNKFFRYLQTDHSLALHRRHLKRNLIAIFCL